MSFALEQEIATVAWIDNASVQVPLNIYATRGSSQPGQIEAGRDFSHLRGGNLLGLTEGIVRRSQYQVFEQLCVAGVDGLRIDSDRSHRTVALRHDFDHPATAGGFDRAGGELGLHFLHLPLNARGLFHEFADAGHAE